MTMKHIDIFDQVIRISAETFEVDESIVRSNRTSDNIPNWDSFNHFKLIAAIESHFCLEFTTDEILEMLSIEQIVEVIGQKKEVGC
jgi:acyl carrier protein